MSNKDRDFYSIKPGFDSKNKELALIRLFFIVTLPNEIPNILFKISY